MKPMRIRWSDNDRYFGPITYARETGRSYRPICAEIEAKDGDGGGTMCRVRLAALGHTILFAVPMLFQPHREWVDTSRHGWSRGPGSGYWDSNPRRYGLSVNDGFLQIFLGRQTGDSSTTQDWSWFLPWRQWRHVRRSFYGVDGALVGTIPERSFKGLTPEQRSAAWDAERAVEDSCPTLAFAFRDFDGEQLIATTKIEEREWRFGTGRFRWLSFFRKSKIRRSLDIRFSGETGSRKGSWKGGTTGTGIDMLPGERHEAAFRRHCEANRMTFVGPALAAIASAGASRTIPLNGDRA